MAKLYFRYGAMSSAKTLNLLAVAHNYRVQGKKVLLIKAQLETRFGKECIKSRAGLEMPADIFVEPDTKLDVKDFEGVNCVLVDDCHFVSANVVEQLREISMVMNVPVICYGLRTDFRTLLFESSKRLMELSDSIEEIKTTCFFCNRKAIHNMRHVNGLAVTEGPSIMLGAEEAYYSTCHECYTNEINKAKEIAKEQADKKELAYSK